MRREKRKGEIGMVEEEMKEKREEEEKRKRRKWVRRTKTNADFKSSVVTALFYFLSGILASFHEQMDIRLKANTHIYKDRLSITYSSWRG